MIKLRVNKGKIQQNIFDFYKGEEVSLCNYWLTSSDCPNYGHVVLVPTKLKSAYTFTQLFDYVDFLVRSNRTFSCELYNKRLKSATSKSIYNFDGELPDNYHVGDIAGQQIDTPKYSIIELIAAGFCETLNPNLISSWGCQIVD